MKRALLLLFLGSAIGVRANAQDILQLPPQRPRAAANVAKPSSDRVRNSPKPEVALPAVLNLLDQYQVVGLSDLHGCGELLAFVQQLIRMPEFGTKVNDFTWEPGNARFQGLMDDFILHGKEIPYKELAQCWRNNTQSHTYSDTPALFGLLKTIRLMNLRQPEARRVRVLLIDPPVDWSKIRSKADFRERDFDRESHMAEVLERAVYAKGRKALFFAGGAHLGRGGAAATPKQAKKNSAGPELMPFGAAAQEKPLEKRGDSYFVSPLQALERKHPGTTFNIAIHEGFGDRTDELEARLINWPKPALAQIRGTWWGELTPPPSGDVFIGPGGKPVQPKIDHQIQDRWDAILFLGKRQDLTRVDPPGPNVLDAEWMSELRRRKEMRGGPGSGLELKEKPFSRQFFSDDSPPEDQMMRLPLSPEAPATPDSPQRRKPEPQ
jgi:hypothetical protein